MVIPSAIDFTIDVKRVVLNKDILLYAVPSVHVRATARIIAPLYSGQIIVDVAKGIESDSLMTMSKVIKSEISYDKVVALSGSTHGCRGVQCYPCCYAII